MTPDLIAATLLLVLAPVLGKVNQKVVDLFKKIDAFRNSSPGAKQAVALLSATVLSWVSNTLKVHLSSADITALGSNDVLTVLIGIIAWFSSMHFYNAQKPAAPPA